MISTETYTEEPHCPPAFESRDQAFASIVHELSSPLTTILGLATLVIEDGKATDPRIAKIQGEAQRSVQIVRNMLALCKAGDFCDGRALVDLNASIRHAAALVEDQLESHGINLAVELPWRVPKVNSRDGELIQVFLNLITNSIQAIASAGRTGTITITGNQLGKRVCITVEDDGPGFKEEDFNRLFQPFFTTKGQGTGLGLNLSRKIVHSIGGEMWATRNPDRGAIFTVELPVSGEERMFVA